MLRLLVWVLPAVVLGQIAQPQQPFPFPAQMGGFPFPPNLFPAQQMMMPMAPFGQMMMPANFNNAMMQMMMSNMNHPMAASFTGNQKSVHAGRPAAPDVSGTTTTTAPTTTSADASAKASGNTIKQEETTKAEAQVRFLTHPTIHSWARDYTQSFFSFSASIVNAGSCILRGVGHKSNSISPPPLFFLLFFFLLHRTHR
jgi:hypothetical protein